MFRSLPCALFLFAASSAFSAPVSLVDDRGATVSLPAPATRIIALAPHLTELAYAAGAGGRLVGAASPADYPAATQKLPVVGDAVRLDFERIAALKPDLILAWKSGNRRGDIEKLEKLGVAVFATEPARPEDVARLLRAIGQLAGTPDAAEAAAESFERELGALRQRYAGRKPVRVFYQVWHDPPMTVNGAHIISAVLELCGGKNIFAQLPALAAAVSSESVVAANPQAILTGDPPGMNGAIIWERFPQIEAVARRHVFNIPPDLLQRPAPRLLQGARLVCEALDEVRR